MLGMMGKQIGAHAESERRSKSSKIRQHMLHIARKKKDIRRGCESACRSKET